MMDYAKTREEALARQADLRVRLSVITDERIRLDKEEEQIKREVAGLNQILDGVELMTSDVALEVEPAGFTDKIRKILSDTDVPLIPTQIRDVMEASGTTGTSSRNLLISIHTVLDRIKDELENHATSEGKIAYKRKLPWVVTGPQAYLAMGHRLRSVAELLAPPTPDPARLPLISPARQSTLVDDRFFSDSVTEADEERLKSRLEKITAAEREHIIEKAAAMRRGSRRKKEV